MNRGVTLVGKRSKSGAILSDFKPEESTKIMLTLVKNLKQAVNDIEEEHIHENERLKQVNVISRDGSLTGQITHVPVDFFGEKHAEVRAVLTVNDNHSRIRTAVNNSNFAVSEV